MNLNKPIRVQDIQNTLEYLTKKWWLPVTLVVVAFINAILGPGLWFAFTVNNTSVIFVVSFINGIIYFASLTLMLAVGIYQRNKKMFVVAWFNVILSISIFLGLLFLGTAIT